MEKGVKNSSHVVGMKQGWDSLYFIFILVVFLTGLFGVLP